MESNVRRCYCIGENMCVCMYVCVHKWTTHRQNAAKWRKYSMPESHKSLKKKKKSNKMKNGQKTKWNIKWNTILMDLNWQKRWFFVSILPSHSAYIHHNWCNDWPNWWWCVLHMAWRTKLLFDMIANFFFCNFVQPHSQSFDRRRLKKRFNAINDDISTH